MSKALLFSVAAIAAAAVDALNDRDRQRARVGELTEENKSLRDQLAAAQQPPQPEGVVLDDADVEALDNLAVQLGLAPSPDAGDVTGSIAIPADATGTSTTADVVAGEANPAAVANPSQL